MIVTNNNLFVASSKWACLCARYDAAFHPTSFFEGSCDVEASSPPPDLMAWIAAMALSPRFPNRASFRWKERKPCKPHSALI